MSFAESVRKRGTYILLLSSFALELLDAQAQSATPGNVSIRLVGVFAEPGPIRADAGHVIGGLRSLVDGKGKRILLWDDANGAFFQQLVLDGESDLSSATEISRDNQIVAASDNDRYVRIWEARTSRLLNAIQVKHDRMRLSPDGRVVAVGSFRGDTVTVFDVRNGKSFQVSEDDDGTSQVSSAIFDFSPDGRLLVLAQKKDRISLWDAKSGAFFKRIVVPAKSVFSLLYGIKFSPQGNLIASYSNGEANLVEIESGKPRFTFPPGMRQTNVMTFSRDGKTVATGGNDNVVRLWDVVSGKLLRSFRHSKDIIRIEFSDPAFGLMIVGENSLKARDAYLWRIETGELVEKGNVWKFSRDGKRLLKTIPETRKLGIFEISVKD